MKHYGDITKLSGYDLPIVDIVTGGSPCQDLSCAGKRKGLQHSALGDEETTRSGLFMEQIRVIKEMREHDRSIRGTDIPVGLIRPRYMVWENVPGAFSSNKGEDFRCVLEETAKIADENASIPRFEGGWSTAGCIMADGWSVAWRTVDAQYFGTPQRRRRISLVADFGGTSAPEILFECQSLSRDSAESEQQKQRVASNSQGNPVKAICIGGGQVNDAMTPSVEVSKTLNCMVDPMKVVVSVDEKMGQTYIGNEIGNTLSARDYKQPQAVCYGLDRASFNQGQNAQYNFSVTEEQAQTIVAKGPGGVLARQ